MSKALQNNEVVKTENNKKSRSKGLTILLIVVLILFLLSSVILGARLYKLATADQYTVNLGLGEPDGSIELFRIEYENELGEITVQGANTDNVVAPGTTVNYDLRLRNQDDVVIDFLMTPAVAFLTDDAVPIEFKIVDSYGNYILGSDTQWAAATDMNELAHKGSIHPDEVFTYHISWRWVFEVDDAQDAYDTYLGSQNGEIPPGVRVSVDTQAFSNPTPVDNNHLTHLFGEGFGCCLCCWLVWLLLLVVVLMVIWVWRLKKKLNKLEEGQVKQE